MGYASLEGRAVNGVRNGVYPISCACQSPRLRRTGIRCALRVQAALHTCPVVLAFRPALALQSALMLSNPRGQDVTCPAKCTPRPARE
jgi:hypothetical protein